VIAVRRIDRADGAPQAGLAELLVDTVDRGASVGFFAPMQAATASAYWDDVLAQLGPALLLWVAEADGAVVGSVQLELCERENGRHRADVKKLFVHGLYRGRGIASMLMAELETQARANGRSLLVLDTLAGSAAESVYRHLGWSRVGEIPEFAAFPDGTLHPTAYYYKILAR
jgi:GNAT superfamily N-acetyltransferase